MIFKQRNHLALSFAKISKLNKNQKILSIQNLTLSVFQQGSQIKLLDNVSLNLDRGKTLALIGTSGSGKSLTSLAILGLLPININRSGSIVYNNSIELIDLDAKSWESIRGKEISMVFQEPMSALNPIMSCGNQLLEVILQHRKISRLQAYNIALEWLDKVQIPDSQSAFKKYPHELSGGQKQRIMIAMALCNAPKILIADEPTTALDVLVQQDVIKLMKELTQESETSVIFISHDMALAKLIADDIIVLDKGKITNNQELINYNNSHIEKGISTYSERDILNLNDVNVVYNPEAKPFHAVKNFTYHFPKGKTTGIVGGSGCGKSTIIKAIMGLVPIHSGDIFITNKNIKSLSKSSWRALRKEIQMIFQDPYASLNPRVDIYTSIKEVINVHEIVDNKHVYEYIHKLLLQVGLDENAMYKYPHEFSGGQRQRLCIARALAVQPKILICDESVAALDIFMQQQIVALLKDLQATYGLTYLFISHDMHIVHQISDEIIVMQDGAIVEHGLAEEIMHRPQHSYTQSLIKAIP